MPSFNNSIRILDPSLQKRKKARARFENEAEIFLKNDKRPIPVMLTDLGTGGIGFQARSILYVGDKVLVNLKLGGNPFRVNAEIMRVNGKSVGAKFFDLSEDDESQIQNFIHNTILKNTKKNP